MKTAEGKREAPALRHRVGVAGVVFWLLALVLVQHAHRMIDLKRDPAMFWSTLYEVSAGYVLGFAAALSVSAAIRLDRGPVPEVLAYGRWARTLAMACFISIFGIAMAGLMMHNLGGPTYTYDIACAIAFVIVFKAVLPLMRDLAR